MDCEARLEDTSNCQSTFCVLDFTSPYYVLTLQKNSAVKTRNKPWWVRIQLESVTFTGF